MGLDVWVWSWVKSQMNEANYYTVGRDVAAFIRSLDVRFGRTGSSSQLVWL